MSYSIEASLLRKKAAIVSLSIHRASRTGIQSLGRHTLCGESRHMNKQKTGHMVGWEGGS